MASGDDLALLKGMYQRGEISDEQYDVLRRHVLWGTPLPRLVDEPPEPTALPLAPAPPATAARTMSPAAPAAYRTAERNGQPPSSPAAPLDRPRRRHADPGPRPAPPAPRAAAGPGRGRPGGASPSPDATPRPGRGGQGGGRRAEVRVPSGVTATPGGRRHRRAPRVIAVAASLVLALAVAAAGVWWVALRKTGVEPAAYARSVCAGVRDWQRDVDGRTGALSRSVAREEDPAAARDSVVTYYTGLAARTDALRGTLVAAGTPDVPDGQVFATALVRAAGDRGAALRESAARAGRLDTASRAAFHVALPTLLVDAGTSVTAISDALAHPASGTPPALADALAADPSCAPYVG